MRVGSRLAGDGGEGCIATFGSVRCGGLPMNGTATTGKAVAPIGDSLGKAQRRHAAIGHDRSSPSAVGSEFHGRGIHPHEGNAVERHGRQLHRSAPTSAGRSRAVLRLNHDSVWACTRHGDGHLSEADPARRAVPSDG